MPYIIAFVIIIVAAGALLLFRQPAEAPAAVTVVETEIVSESLDESTDTQPSDESVTEADVAQEAPAAATDTQTYVAEASYFTPNRTEHDMVITLELAGETIVDSNITYDNGPAQTPNHQNFDNAYGAVVIGQNINTIELSRVGGASLTSEAFNEAVADIRAQI